MDAFPPEFERDVLSHIVYDTEFVRKNADKIKPEHFSGKEQWILCTLAYDFFERYDKAPRQNLKQEVAKYARRSRMSSDSAALLAQAFDDLEKPKGDSQYLMDEIDGFVKHQEVKTVLEDFIPKYHQGEYDLDDFTREISKIQLAHAKVDSSTDVLEGTPGRITERLVKKKSRPIASLIEPLDEYLVGITPPKLGTIIAPSGTGKSFFCGHLAKAAALQGERVFYYTGEMSAEEVIQRIDQMMVGTNADGLILPGTAKRLMLTMKMMKRNGGQLFVDFFPFPSTTLELRRNIASKAAAHGAPGLIIVDAAERLEPSQQIRSGARNEMIGRVWQELHQICVDYNAPMWATNQGNISAVGAKRVTELQNAFGYDVIRISDIVLGFNRNIVYNSRKGEWQEIDEEYNPDVVRLFMIKNRGRSDKHDIRFACNLDKSQFYSKTATEVMMHDISQSPRGKKNKQKYIGEEADIDD